MCYTYPMPTETDKPDDEKLVPVPLTDERRAEYDRRFGDDEDDFEVFFTIIPQRPRE